MPADPMSRRLRVPVAIVVLGVAAVFAYRFTRSDPMTAPVLGVVHETEVRIAPEASGRLAAIKVRAGDQVRKGDVLAVLSNPELAASLDEARASAASARADQANVLAGVRREQIDSAAQNILIAEANLVFARQQQARAAILAARDFTSRQQLDESTASLNKAEASLALAQATYAEDQAGPTREARDIAAAQVVQADATVADIEARLAKTTLVAPSDGVVGLIVSELGEAINPGQAVMTLDAGRQRWFTFTVREDRLGRIAIGATIRLETALGGHIDARVTELRPLGEFAVWRAARAVGDHDINSFLVRADPLGDVAGLEPGMTVWLARGGGAAR
jgi:HlyD family secretion protein